jgi:hypothetical protein
MIDIELGAKDDEEDDEDGDDEKGRGSDLFYREREMERERPNQRLIKARAFFSISLLSLSPLSRSPRPGRSPCSLAGTASGQHRCDTGE